MTNSCKTCRKKVAKVLFYTLCLLRLLWSKKTCEALPSDTYSALGDRKKVCFVGWKYGRKTRHGDWDLLHQTFQVPKVEVFTEMASKPTPKIAL